MKILVTCLPDLKRTNPQRAHHLLKYLSKKHEITVLNVKAGRLREKNDEFLFDSIKNLNIEYISEKNHHPMVQELLVYNKLNYGKKHDFDVHINFNSLIAGNIVSRKIRFPTVFDICDDLIDWINISPQVPQLIKPLGTFTASKLLRCNIHSSDMITYSLENLKTLYNISDGNSRQLPNGVDVSLFYNYGKSCKEQIGLSNNDFVLGFVGFLGNWVDFEMIFKTIKEIKGIDIKFLIVGEGDRLNYFKELAEKYSIMENLLFVGDQPYLEVPKYISAMDIALLPFDSNNVSQGALPLKLFEYMACEKPVISTPLIGVKKSVGDLVIYASDISELKDQIMKLHECKDIMSSMGKKGRNFVIQNYEWGTLGQKFEKILGETVDGAKT